MTDRTKIYVTYVTVDNVDSKRTEKSIASMQCAVDKLYTCPESLIELILNTRNAKKNEEFGVEISATGGSPEDIMFALICVLDTLGKREFEKYLNTRPILRPIQTALTGM